jgi:F-type H+-transporting ATPase subunit epsilon
MSSLNIEIVTPRGVKYSGDAQGCTAPGVDGIFQILPDHAALLSLIDIGEIKFSIQNKERYMATSGGFLEVKANHVTIMVETAEWAEDIEVDRARAAEERARKHLEQKEGIDYARAQLALARALNRIKVAKHI